MKKIKVRKDLMSKQEYHKKTGISRDKINLMIEDGELAVEEIGNIHYIIIK